MKFQGKKAEKGPKASQNNALGYYGAERTLTQKDKGWERFLTISQPEPCCN